MSQISSQAQDPNWVSIPFAKFSHHSSLFGTRNITWNHIGLRNDLDLILRNIRVVDDHGKYNTRIVMKITAGAEVLEEQDLGELVQAVRGFDPSSGNEHPVQVVIKSPFLAIRYPKSANIIRRIQLKFHNDYDFSKVLQLTKDLGFPITGTITPTPSTARPSVSPAESLFSTTSASSTISVPSMISASSGSTSSTTASPVPPPGSSFNTAQRAFDNLCNTTSTSSSKSEFKVPVRPNTPSLNAQRSINALHSIHPQIARPATTLGVVAPPETTSSLPGLGLSYDSMKQSSSLYLSQMEKESQFRRLSHPTSPSISRRGTRPQQDLPMFLSQLDSQQEPIPKRKQDPELSLSASPFFAPRNESLSFTGAIPVELEKVGQEYGRQESDSLDSQRVGSKLPETNEMPNLWVPPRQESPCSNPAHVYKQRSSSFSVLPPLPQPTPVTRPGSVDAMTSEIISTTSKVSTPFVKPTKKRVAQRKAAAAKPAIEGDTPASMSDVVPIAAEAEREDEPSPLAAKSAAAASGPSSAGLQTKVTASKKRAAVSTPARPASSTKKPKMIDQGTQTQTLSGRDHTTATRPSNDEVPPVIINPLHATPVSLSILEDNMDTLEAFVTKHKARPTPKELWEAPGYVDADEEQRQVILNHFICENLENVDFLQLCKDTENAWRRIGLGM